MRFGIHIGPTPFKSSERSIPPDMVEKMDISYSPVEWLGELLALAAIITHIVLLTTQYQALPDIIPTHFGFNGQADGWGGKGTLLVLLGANIIICVLMTVTSFLPRLYNFAVPITEENAGRQFLLTRGMLLAMKALIAWLFCYLCQQIIGVAMGRASGLGWIIWLLLGLLLAVIAVTMVLSYKWR